MPKPKLEVKNFLAFRPNDPALSKAMADLQERDGISTSEQIRRALRAWLPTKGVYTPEGATKKTAKKGTKR